MVRTTQSRTLSRAIAELTKAGIVLFVALSTAAGYLICFPLDESLNPVHFLFTILTTSFLTAGASAFNQIQEAELDSRMPRTRERPLPSGTFARHQAAIISLSLLSIGMIFAIQISAQMAALGLLAFVFYNLLYTLWWKPNWAFAAVPGALPGALPVLMGCTAATGSMFTPAGIFLFALMFFWQMPHFWVLAIRYQEDYRQGGVPTLPVSHGSRLTLQQIVVWCLAYLALAAIAPLFVAVGWIYFAVFCFSVAVVLRELRRYAMEPASALPNPRWIRFFLAINFSLMAFLVALAIDRWSIYLWIPLTQ